MEIKPAARCGWRAWYAPDRVYASDVTLPWKLPLTGLQIVVVYWDSGAREIISGQTDPGATVDVWYAFWSDLQVHRLEGARADVGADPAAVLVQGVWTTDAEYNAIYNLAWASRWYGPDHAPTAPRVLTTNEQEANCETCP